MTDTSIETVLTVIYDAFGTDLRRMAKNIEGNIYNFEILQSDNNVILGENSSLCSCVLWGFLWVYVVIASPQIQASLLRKERCLSSQTKVTNIAETSWVIFSDCLLLLQRWFIVVMLLLCNPPWRLWPLPPHVILHVEKTEQLLVFDG